MDNELKWFHAIGVCGKTTANVAKMFKRMGWFVTGTDMQFIPPASNLLIEEGIHTEVGYHFSHLTKEFWENKLGKRLNIPKYPTLGLIVESATSKNKEYLFAKKQGIDIRPFSQILKDYLIKPESIVVVGTAGKTTTTALITYLLKELGINPSYMIGADVIDFKDSLQNTESEFSVIEGDEYYSKELSTGAKFLQFKPKYGVITKLSWEHVDVYPTEEEYVKEFKKFIDLIPDNGLIIAKADDSKVDSILTNSNSSIIRYKYIDNLNIPTNSKNIFFISYNSELKEYSIINSNNDILLNGKTNLLGEYNLENVLAAFIVFSKVLNRSDFETFATIVSKFRGPKKRLEKLYESDQLVIIDDFGVAPERAENSLRTLKQNYPNYKITAVFEPNSGSRPEDRELFNRIYNNAFKNADKVIIPSLSNTIGLVQTEEFVKNLKELNVNVLQVSTDNINNYLKAQMNKEKSLIVFFSAYRLTQVAHDLVKEINYAVS